MKLGAKLYLDTNVYDEAVSRISMMLDMFENIVVSFSGGKDSTALLSLCKNEALLRNRKVNVFFLDQEAEYMSTIEIMRCEMNDESIFPFCFF